jgi:hypothetical protein
MRFKPKKGNYMKDTSIFQGIIEFTSPDGLEIQAHTRSEGFYSIYVKEKSTWVHDMVIRINGKPSPKKIWSEYNRV